MNNLVRIAISAAAMGLGCTANAAITKLTFEGIADVTEVGNFYAGQGYVFSSGALAIVDLDAGGSGTIQNEPSPDTVVALAGTDHFILDYAAGFANGFSFYYSSFGPITVTTYDGAGGTGAVLAVSNGVSQNNDNCDTHGAHDLFCNWTKVTVSFAGIAQSIRFAGTDNLSGFDDIAFGSNRGGVPEPASWALLISGFGMVGTALRRRRAALTT